MEPELITKFRQVITQNMTVINYDKATINAAIESVYQAIVNETQLPDKGSFTTEQFDVIVGVIQAVIDNENENHQAADVDKIAPIFDETKAIFNAMLKPIRDNIEAAYPDNTDEENDILVKNFLTKFIN